MRKFMITAAAMALLAPLGAAAGDKDKPGDKMKSEMKTEAQMQTGEKAEKARMGDVIYLESDQLSAKELLGEGVIGEGGERIARIDDIIIGDDGKASSVVFLSGGFFGLGGKKGALDYDRVDLKIAENHDPRVKVSMTEQAIKTVAEFKAEGANDYSLASELIGASARLQGGDEEAVISDIIFGRDGEIRYVIAHKGLMDVLSADRRAFAFSDLTIEQGAGGIVLDTTASAFDDAPRFEYRQTTKMRNAVPGVRYDPQSPDQP